MRKMFFLEECGADPPPCYADSAAILTQDAGRRHLTLARLTSVPARRRNFAGALAAHRAFVKQTLAEPYVRWVRSEADIMALPAGYTGVLFGTQHAPEGMTKANVGEWRAARLQFMALAGADSGGLTDYGRRMVEWMSEHNIVLDLSHANHQTAREALEFVRHENLPLNVMASSSGCAAIFPHPRNLPDDILAGIVNQAGYVGIPTNVSLLAEEGDDPLAFIRHIAHASRVCGSNNIGVGSSDESVSFEMLSLDLVRKFSTSATKDFLGRNFEYFLLRSLPAL